jgi:hypothetical protein
MLGGKMMGTLAFDATRFVRLTLRSIVFYLSIIAVASVMTVKPAQASGTVLPQINSYCVTFFYIGGYHPHACSSSTSAACAMLLPGSSYSAACGGYCVTDSNCSLPASVNGDQSFYNESTCPGNTTTTTPPCICKDPYVPEEPDRTRCVLVQYTLTLIGMEGEVEPSGTAGGGNSTRMGYVSVIDAQTKQPKSGAKVRVTVNVDISSGGHDHGEKFTRRNRGTISGCAATNVLDAYDCTTSSNGYAQFTFGAPEASGTHSFTAECISPACTSTASGNVDVKVDGLVAMQGSDVYEFVGAVPGVHADNHYLTPVALYRLVDIATAYHKFFPNTPVLRVNDASLVWGGKFDVFGHWAGDHAEHRRGTVIDIRANSSPGAILPENFISFRRFAKDIRADAKIHHPGEDTQHFHVRLLNREE